MTAAAPTVPRDVPTMKGEPPTFCPLCDGHGRNVIGARDYGTCQGCRGTGLATCGACLAETGDVAIDTCERVVCIPCIPKLAWRCETCGETEAVAKPDGGAIDGVFCAQCGRDAELVTCKRCGCALEDADESVCDDCAEPYCQHCAGSGEGSHDGARCFACKGDGVER